MIDRRSRVVLWHRSVKYRPTEPSSSRDLYLRTVRTSQWLNAAPYATLFLYQPRKLNSFLEDRRPVADGEIISLSNNRQSSSGSTVFKTGTPRYITTNAMSVFLFDSFRQSLSSIPNCGCCSRVRSIQSNMYVKPFIWIIACIALTVGCDRVNHVRALQHLLPSNLRLTFL